MIVKIDDLLIDYIFQPFAHRLQQMTGKDNFFLALICCMASTLCLLCASIYRNGTPHYFIPGFLSLVGFLNCWSISRNYYNSNKRQSTRTFNDSRIRHFNFRLVSLILLFITIILVTCSGMIFDQSDIDAIEGSLLTCSALFYLSYSYLLACTPLPPGTSKIGNMIRSGIKWLKSIVSSPGELAPAPSPT
jgi:hypothetical protein